MLEGLGQSLRETIRKITRASYVDREIVDDVVRDIQRALLKSDVNVQLALRISKKVQDRALNEKPPEGMSPRNYIIRIIYEELVSILGKGKEIKLVPQKIMLVGLYGHGKTTTAGKIARFFMRKGLAVHLVACDVHRPAAMEQLEQIGAQLNVPVFSMRGENDATRIAKEYLKIHRGNEVAIFDTSGRHDLEDSLIQELKILKEIIKPDEIFLVLDATIGQMAGRQAKAFNEAVGITGVILTKMDGTAKGGGALSAVAETGAPIAFIGTGEHLDDIEIFDPKRFISRLLGLGDLQTLLETAKELEIDEKEAEKTAEKLLSGKFNLKDMYEIWEQVSKPGILQKIFSSIPTFSLPGGEKLDDSFMEKSEEKLKKYRVILDSMTYEELENPGIIKGTRIDRIARGSGTRPEDVRELLKEFNNMVNAMKNMKGNRKMMRLLKKQFGKEMPGLDEENQGS
ncbi:MAG: signal recognition particle protein Srp54 [Thermoplasmata archaeon]|jgi:signal recognition particle subunit SRP54|nr:signal recognition particle protein [Thermoplasmatales archaeon]PMP74206.1 MAG: signal recognition particle protein [Aciduliprofundum sp.]